jgi:hypothetical protein
VKVPVFHMFGLASRVLERETLVWPPPAPVLG